MKAIISKFLMPMGMQTDQAGGLLDFIIGFILILMPWFYVQDGNVLALTCIMVLGSALILYSIFTDYRHGIIRFLMQKGEAILDLTLGVTIMALWPLKLSMAGVILIGILIITLTALYII